MNPQDYKLTKKESLVVNSAFARAAKLQHESKVLMFEVTAFLIKSKKWRMASRSANLAGRIVDLESECLPVG